MATKAKKGKGLSPSKEVHGAKPWPDLPEQLLGVVSRQPALLQSISYGGVTKSWCFAPRDCNPTSKSTLPQLYDTRDLNAQCDGTNETNIFNITFHRGYEWWYRPCKFRCWEHNWFSGYRQQFLGYSHGLGISRDIEKHQYFLWDPLKQNVSLLADWDTNIPFKYVSISSSFEDYKAYALMVVTGISNPAFVFYYRAWSLETWTDLSSFGDIYYPNSHRWIKQECSLIDPHSSSKQYMQFTNAIGFKGKFYAISVQGTLVAIDTTSRIPEIVAVSSSRAVPSVSSRQFRECLIESNGEILLVFLISTASTKIVDDVEIFRLQLPKLTLMKVERLGDRALFVGGTSCTSVAASKVGCKGNCVYFTHRGVHGWCVYDMDKGVIDIRKSPEWHEFVEEDVTVLGETRREDYRRRRREKKWRDSTKGYGYR